MTPQASCRVTAFVTAIQSGAACVSRGVGAGVTAGVGSVSATAAGDVTGSGAVVGWSHGLAIAAYKATATTTAPTTAGSNLRRR